MEGNTVQEPGEEPGEVADTLGAGNIPKLLSPLHSHCIPLSVTAATQNWGTMTLHARTEGDSDSDSSRLLALRAGGDRGSEALLPTLPWPLGRCHLLRSLFVPILRGFGPKESACACPCLAWSCATPPEAAELGVALPSSGNLGCVSLTLKPVSLP